MIVRQDMAVSSRLDAGPVSDWIADWLSRELPMPLDDIDRNETLDIYGVSSLMIVIMSGELEDLLGRPVDPTVIYDHPTINALAAHFAAQGMEPS